MEYLSGVDHHVGRGFVGDAHAVRDGAPPFVLTNVTRLEEPAFVIQVTQTIDTTGVVQNPQTYRYSKSPPSAFNRESPFTAAGRAPAERQP